jgi:hypothetical protein
MTGTSARVSPHSEFRQVNHVFAELLDFAVDPLKC